MSWKTVNGIESKKNRKINLKNPLIFSFLTAITFSTINKLKSNLI